MVASTPEINPLIKFFRKIRKDLLSEGKMEKCFKYAFGELAGIGNLQSIGGGMLLRKNYLLKDLTGLAKLTSIGNYLEINKCNELTDLVGLDSLKSIDVSSLQPGIYIIEVASGKSRYTKKLVIL